MVPPDKKRGISDEGKSTIFVYHPWFVISYPICALIKIIGKPSKGQRRGKSFVKEDEDG